ncbi:C4-dicarboxylate ABC transporter substrate-binding protein [Thioclava sp. SK-1]|nr:C4-dicarboxylate ABC transporter substrate-binding protein [Thioclava sp. SK-1]
MPRSPARLVLAVLCGVMLLAMMGLTVTDVIGRYVFNAPLIGATELTEMLLAAVIFLGLPAVSGDGDHVTVDLLVHRFPCWVQPIRQVLIALFSAGMLAVIAWRIWVYAAQIGSYGGATNSLRLPIAPLGYVCALCCAAGVVLTVCHAVIHLRDE